jgi:hypothetical protein
LVTAQRTALSQAIGSSAVRENVFGSGGLINNLPKLATGSWARPDLSAIFGVTRAHQHDQGSETQPATMDATR